MLWPVARCHSRWLWPERRELDSLSHAILSYVGLVEFSLPLVRLFLFLGRFGVIVHGHGLQERLLEFCFLILRGFQDILRCIRRGIVQEL